MFGVLFSVFPDMAFSPFQVDGKLLDYMLSKQPEIFFISFQSSTLPHLSFPSITHYFVATFKVPYVI